MLKRSRVRGLVVLIGILVFASIGYVVLHNSHAATNADINNDGKVDVLDLSILASNFNQTGKTFSQGDITGDGIVNVFDFSVLAGQWGQTGGGTACTGVNVSTGGDIQAAINANPTGTTFCISGSHSITTAILPKTGDKLIGATGSVIDGGNTATVAIDGNNVANVTIKGLLIQHFNNANLIPAVGKNNEGSGWVIENNEVANNATEGVFAGASSTVKNNHIHHNGQLGISGFQANNAVIDSNEIDHNGASQYTTNEGGGLKFYKGTNVTVSNNNVHDNIGTGIWLDTDVVSSSVTGNTVTNNADSSNSSYGIEIEITCNVTVTNNTITGTASETNGVMLSSSHDVTVSGNTISGTKNGITLWMDNTRSTQTTCGAPSINNNHVSSNTITLASGSSHVTGVYLYNGGTYTGTAPTGISFTGNHYMAPDCTAAHWQWYVTSNLNYTFSQWQGLGQDTVASGSSCSANSIYWGSWIDGDTYSLPDDAPWSASIPGGSWDLFEQHAGKKVSILHFGQPSPWIQAFAATPLNNTVQRGAIPMMDMNTGSVALTDITNGTYDSSIITWANAVKAWGKPFFLRWNWEMNGTWFSWGSQAKTNPTNYTNAWKHIHDVVAGQGANNVTWVWCPNTEFSGSTSLGSLYPGDSYVDWTCIDGYNWGTNPYKSDSWKSFSQVFTQTYNDLLALAPTKPIMIGETASTEIGGSKPAWITDALSTQLPTNYPKVKAVVWFNWNFIQCAPGAVPPCNTRMDWQIESSTTAQSAFASGISSSYYTSNNYGSLPPLTKVPLP